MATMTRQYLTEMDILKMAADEGVSPREFLERLLNVQERHFRDLIDERDRRYSERFEAQEKAVRAALNAADTATGKFEDQEAEWRRNANEWRDAMKDREKEFLGRPEAMTAEKNQAEKMAELQKRLAAIELSGAAGTGTSSGRDKTWDLILTMLPIVVSVIGVVLVLVLNN